MLLKKKRKKSDTSFRPAETKKRKLKPKWETEKEWEAEREKINMELIADIKNERGIIKGRNVTVNHSGKPWLKSSKKTSGKIIQVTDYFFVVRNSSPAAGYCECFDLIDLRNSVIQVK